MKRNIDSEKQQRGRVKLEIFLPEAIAFTSECGQSPPYALRYSEIKCIEIFYELGLYREQLVPIMNEFFIL
jgi:hypothetical protein